jgi:ABC-type lipoprotein export system ATPase subunit
MELLEGLCAQRGVTLLLVTHDPVLRARFDHALELP